MSANMLKKAKLSLKNNPSTANASNVIFNLAGDGGLYDDIRDYNCGEYAPQDVVENQLKDLADNDDPADAKDDMKVAKEVGQYDDILWLDFNTLKPITAKDAMNIVDDLTI